MAAPTDNVDLGNPQFSSHKWAEPIFVVTIMVVSLYMNRRRDSNAIQGKLLPDTPSLNDESVSILSGETCTASMSVHPKTRGCCGITYETPDTSRFADHFHSRVLQKFPFLVEMFYWALNYVAYSFTKSTASARFATVDGVVQLAQDHGISILNLEHNSALRFLFPINEADFQAFFTTGHPLLLTIFNRLYSLVHIPGTVAFLSWYYYAAPNHSTYAVARRTMTLGNFAAFIIFCFYPCMPPRLLPESFGFHDTVRQGGAESVWVGGKNVNQLAAMPSLHFTYAFVIGCTFIYHSGILRRFRGNTHHRSMIGTSFWLIMGIIYPLLVLSVIVATANHYWLDAAVALLTTTTAFLCNRIWMIFLPAEDVLCWCLRLRKPVPTTGSRFRENNARKLDESGDYQDEVV